jgi:hypothetical protein
MNAILRASKLSDVSTFPVRLPMALNKCNRILSAFQSNFVLLITAAEYLGF